MYQKYLFYFVEKNIKVKTSVLHSLIYQRYYLSRY